MFQLPATISLAIDAFFVIMYFTDPGLFGDSFDASLKHNMRLGRAAFVLVILAGLRIVFFLPYIWQYRNDKRMLHPTLPLLWQLANLCVIAAKTVNYIYQHEDSSAQWSLVALSAVSVLCQMICVNHLKSSAVPERHVAIGAYLGKSLQQDANEGLLETQSLLSVDEEHLADENFMANMKKRFEKARDTWNGKVAQLQSFIDEVQKNIGESDYAMFDCLLELYTAQGHESIEDLMEAFRRHPDEVQFYLPQLAVLLVYGSFESLAQLQGAVLHMCRSSVHFAHRLYWFINAFCMSGAGIAPEGVESLRQFLQLVETNGEIPAQELARGRGPSEQTPAGTYVNPDVEGAGAKYDHYPIGQTKLPSTSRFEATIMFFEKLAEVSRNLAAVPKTQRDTEMRGQLVDIDSTFLPASSIYVPIGNLKHRIWSIQLDECFTFSTKDRAPMFVCLEVVDYAPAEQKRAKRKWWNPKNLRNFSKTFRLGRRTFTLDFGSKPDAEDTEAGAEEIEFARPSTVSNSLSAQNERLLKESKSAPVSPDHLTPSSAGLSPEFFGPDSTRFRTSSDLGLWRALPAEVEESPGIDALSPVEMKTAEATPRPADYSLVRNESEDDELPPDPSAGRKPTIIFKEPWKVKEQRIRETSPVSDLPGWRLLPIILKANDDLRQEQLASQVLQQMWDLLLEGGVDVWMRPYAILAISPDSGIIEAIPDTLSLDALKKHTNGRTTLLEFFEQQFGDPSSARFERARDNFIRSLAAYSIATYLLQVKDRHNGNILLDSRGHIIHIDFGFILGRTPGGNFGFETAPFKLTREFIEVIGPPRSRSFLRFRELCVKTFMELRKSSHKIVLLVDMLAHGNEHLPCFSGKPHLVVESLRQRFMPDLHDRACIEHVHTLIDRSLSDWTTTCYDSYQRCFVGIL